MDTNESVKLPLTSKSGKVTMAIIDGPDDIWVVAIVERYRGCQDYGDIICEFGIQDSFTLTDTQARRVLEALDPSNF